MNLRTNVHFFSFFLDKDETFGRIVFPKYRFLGRIFRTNNKCFMKIPAMLSAWDGKIFGTDWCDSKQEAIDKWNELVGDVIN